MATITASQLKQLAKDYQKTGKELLQYKLDHFNDLSIDEFKTLGGKIDIIFHNANTMAALAVIQTGKDISSSLTTLTDATAKMNGALKKINKVQKAINIATAVVNVGTSVIQGDVKGIVGSIKTFSEKIAEFSQ